MLVVGAGIVGLAVAAQLARSGRDVIAIERHGAVLQETSSRNSEVIHAGIYYPPGSLKAALCVAGCQALTERCQRLGIPHRILGKLVVAADASELPVLERLLATGAANGVTGLRLVDAADLQRLEPAVRGAAALHSPVSGVVDSHALALSYAAEAEAHGAVLLLHTRLDGIDASDGGYRVAVRGSGGERETVRCAALVNAAGLEADAVAALAGIDVDAAGYRLHPCKGDYFALAPGAPLTLSRLVYPVPAGAGLGVHATPDLGGRIRFGPDAQYVSRIDYRVDPRKAEAFAAAVGRYLPELRPEWLAPDFAGIRPKLAGPGTPFRDFVVAEESAAGLPGFVNLIGIELPGLTAAPAIAERVAELLRAL